MENVGTISVNVVCDRGGFDQPIVVTANYKTIAGTAKEHEDFVPVSGVLRLDPDQTELFLSFYSKKC